MLTKFENRSNRVKGLAFHPKRPWIIASLHNGAIQLWDYRMELLIDKFEEHEGPVRGIDFHPSQPLFVSGGDDYKIKVWNYQQKKCLFNLLGHLDYIRTVQFHPEYPWIVSASDDQTVRIWNWQSRSCVSVLTGHNHYVMCAQFHPKDDLLLTASLDQTIRVWDFGALRRKLVSIGGNKNQEENVDVSVKHILEGHSRGVNWACFHKTQPLIVSGADDREVKMWRMTETKAWECDAFRGHTNNVSCVLFHPKRDLVISNSEDKSVRVWDTSRQIAPSTWRRDDRFWILASHPTVNLLAAGHDTGLVIFKLERERPAYDVAGSSLFYFKDRYVRLRDEKRDVPIACIRRIGSAASANTPRTLYYNGLNTAEHNILVFCANDGGVYELYNLKKNECSEDPSVSRGSCLAVCFTSRTRFAVLENATTVGLKNLQNETKKKITLPFSANYMFPATIGNCLLRTADSIVLFELENKQVVNKISTLARHPVKYTSWSMTNKFVALVSKFLLYICDSNLKEMCMWDSKLNVLIYTTSTHIKYCLPNGDNGIVRTLDVPIYMVSVNETITCLDRETKIRSIGLDNTEYAFKLHLSTKNFKAALAIMKSNKLVGQSILAYLQKQNYPGIALHFVQDVKTKFALSLECGNIKVALECAREINSTDTWHRLGIEALRQGNHQIVEMTLQKTKNFDRLSFLYLITGNIEKLSKMLAISQLRKDSQARFSNALLLGNVEERITVLREVGQTKLAYLTAKLHGLDDIAAEIEGILGVENIPDVSQYAGDLLTPPIPIMPSDNWPLVDIGGDAFDDENVLLDNTVVPEDDTAAPKFIDDDEPDPVDPDGWGADDIILNPDDVPLPGQDPIIIEDGFHLPGLGKSISDKWSELPYAGALAAAGHFEACSKQLGRQFGITNLVPMKPMLLNIYQCSQVWMPRVPTLSPVETPLSTGNHPSLPYSLGSCLESVKVALKAVTDGKFAVALELFKSLLLTLPLLHHEKSNIKEVLELVSVCREYITALRLELLRRETSDPVRQFELALYFVRCDLQPIHVFLGLRVAIKCGYTIKCFKTTALLCRRLLELSTTAKLPQTLLQGVDQIKNVLKACEKTEQDNETIKYEEKPYSLDCANFLPMFKYKNESVLICALCSSAYSSNEDGRICDTCGVSKVGLDGSGFGNKF